MLTNSAFRYDYRRLTDLERFMIVVAQVFGKRLSYAELTGEAGEKDPI